MSITFQYRGKIFKQPCKVIQRYQYFTLLEIKGRYETYKKCFLNWDIDNKVVVIK